MDGKILLARVAVRSRRKLIYSPLVNNTFMCTVHGGVLFVTLIYLEVCISIELSDKKRSIMVHALLPH